MSSDQPVKGVVQGTIENIVFQRQVELAPHSTQQITFDTKTTPALHIEHPRLWWPNGYGEPESVSVASAFKADGNDFRRRRMWTSASARLPIRFRARTH